MHQVIAPIISNREVMPGINLMRIESPEISSEAQPGQFVMITCDSSRERILRRPISIHGLDQGSLDLLFASVGSGTEWLANRRIGEKVDILGPIGNGFSIQPEARNVLLVAGGIGIAPLCELARKAVLTGLRVRLLAGSKTASLVCPSSLLPEECELFPVTEDGTVGEKGLVTSLLPRNIDWADQIFICGPLPMYKAIVNNYFESLKYKSVQISLEVRMGCGMGFCYACTVKTRQGLKQVCKDGPVFNLQDVVWEELK